MGVCVGVWVYKCFCCCNGNVMGSAMIETKCSSGTVVVVSLEGHVSHVQAKLIYVK